MGVGAQSDGRYQDTIGHGSESQKAQEMRAKSLLYKFRYKFRLSRLTRVRNTFTRTSQNSSAYVMGEICVHDDHKVSSAEI